MQDFVYPAAFQPESRGAFTVTLPDFPEAITSGRNRADALTEAEDCLQEAIAGRMVRKEDIPAASRPKRGQAGIPVALYLAPSWRCTWRCAKSESITANWPGVWALE